MALRALRAEMNKRGLWNAPPAWLGYKEWSRWDENRFNEKLNSHLSEYPDAFTDLLFACYTTAIIEPLSNLQAHLKISDNIDSLVFRNINWFITHLQKTDRLGYYVALHAIDAVQCAIDKGIFVPTELNHKGKVGNKTLLTVSSSDTSTTPSENAFILEVLRNNPSWKDIRLKLAGKTQSVQEPLCEIICQLTESGILCFRFKALVDAMKEDVRVAKDKDDAERLAKTTALAENTAIEELDDESSQIVQLIEPDTTEEEYESFLDLVKQVKEAIDRLKCNKSKKGKKNVRERLHQLFAEIVDSLEREDIVPPQAQFARLLNISKATLSGDMKRLHEVVQQVVLVKRVKEVIDERLKTQLRVRERVHKVFAEIVDSIEQEDIVPPQTQFAIVLNILKATLSGDMKILREVLLQLVLVKPVKEAIDERLKTQQRVRERVHKVFAEIVESIKAENIVLLPAELVNRLNISKATRNGELKILREVVLQLVLVKPVKEAIYDRLKTQPRVRERVYQVFAEIVDSLKRENIVLLPAELVNRLNISKATRNGELKILREVVLQLVFVKPVKEAIDKLKIQQLVRERVHKVFAEIVESIKTEEIVVLPAELLNRLNISKATLSEELKILHEVVQKLNDLKSSSLL
jgi:DNA-binding transcriptional regulator YiaG